MATTSASASGKLILFGEHAVVHGQPAIAVPLGNLRTTANIEDSPPGAGLTISAPGISDDVLHYTPSPANKNNALFYTISQVLAQLSIQQPPDIHVDIESQIPIGAGMGSGAAISTALVRALIRHLEYSIGLEELNTLVYEVEKIHHGTPSGIDNTVIVYEKPVFFVRGTSPETFAVSHAFQLLVADAGHRTPTHVTVGDVRKLYEQKPKQVGEIFTQIGDITRQAREAIQKNDLSALGQLMNDNHALLRELTVSDERLDQLCAMARKAGAIGAKLSGGGRGGNLIALVTPDSAPFVQSALADETDQKVFLTTVG